MLSNYHTLKCTLLWIVLLGAGSLSAQTDTTRILFIGNSFTYYYNLPQVLHTMAASQGTVLLTRQSTVGGSGLELHWKGEKDSKARQLLEEQSWDYVVLNNHSLATIDAGKGGYPNYDDDLGLSLQSVDAANDFCRLPEILHRQPGAVGSRRRDFCRGKTKQTRSHFICR
jgi:hypothetical protein